MRARVEKLDVLGWNKSIMFSSTTLMHTAVVYHLVLSEKVRLENEGVSDSTSDNHLSIHGILLLRP